MSLKWSISFLILYGCLFANNYSNEENKSNNCNSANNNECNSINTNSLIETTQMIANRKQIDQWDVIHETNWSYILNSFNIQSKKYLDIKQDADVFIIDALSPEECTKLIQLAELYGYGNFGNNPDKFKSYRSRLSTNDISFRNELYSRIKDSFPTNIIDDNIMYEICGLNERFRWIKYIKGQKFNIHIDAGYKRNKLQKSFYTVNIYLNSGNKDFTGGRTLFYHLNNTISSSFIPKTGTALIFRTDPDTILHSGEEIHDGVKYLLRTDVMYQIVSNEIKYKDKSEI